MPKLRTVLLVSQRPSDYVEMRRCALALVERGYRPQILYHCVYGDIASEREILNEIANFVEQGRFARAELLWGTHQLSPISKVELDKVEESLRQRPRRRRLKGAWRRRRQKVRYIYKRIATLEMRSRVRRFMVAWGNKRVALSRNRVWIGFWDFVSQMLTQLYVLKIYHSRLAVYRNYIKSTQPSVIILPEDVVGMVTPLVIKAGHHNDVPSLIVPYTIADQQEAFRSLQGQPNYQARHWINFPVAMLFRSWTMRQNGIYLVRLPAAYILGHVLTRTSPPDPWMMNSGFANAIAIENRAMYDFYRRAGIPETKMQVVGAPYDDQLASFLANKENELATVRRSLGITGDKPLLLIGGCPDQTGSCPGFEFKDMKDFAAQLAAALGMLKDEYAIVVRPHPNYPQLGEMLSGHGIITTEIDTARLVALSDLYIAFASATIRWAIACGVPTINYDVFQYDYDDFKKVAGVVTLMRYEDFRRTVAGMHRNDSQWAALGESARKDAPRWGQLDGKSLDRIVALIESLCSLKPVPRTAS